MSGNVYTKVDDSERIAVVTGAARGLGRAIAEGLAARGDAVALVDLLEPSETAGTIASAGGRAASFVCDVADPAQVDALRGRVHAELGACAILVNNAALLGSAPIFDVDYETWRRTITTNLDSQFLLVKAFLPDMVERRWGRIVNVASSSILTSTPGLTAYMASKGGVLGFTSALANDVGRHGVTVNAVSPGFTRTPAVERDIAAGVVPADAVEAVIAQQAIPREGTAEDIVGTVLFLTGDAAAFMTGQFLVADGGMTRH